VARPNRYSPVADCAVMESTDELERDERPRDYQAVHDGRLPVSELLFDRPGAASPFGDDQTFPLPVSALVYRHPE
jgi:hypothetical protein